MEHHEVAAYRILAAAAITGDHPLNAPARRCRNQFSVEYGHVVPRIIFSLEQLPPAGSPARISEFVFRVRGPLAGPFLVVQAFCK